jgi:hypothetical protein
LVEGKILRQVDLAKAKGQKGKIYFVDRKGKRWKKPHFAGKEICLPHFSPLLAKLDAIEKKRLKKETHT